MVQVSVSFASPQPLLPPGAWEPNAPGLPLWRFKGELGAHWAHATTTSVLGTGHCVRLRKNPILES